MILASHLHKSFGATRAVDDLSLEVRSGEIYGLVGPDGAGKTTTLRLLVGALRPERAHKAAPPGQALIDGIDINRHPEDARARLGYLSQRFSLYEELTVLENIRFFAEVRGLPAERWLARSQEILDFVDLLPFAARRAGQLSGGMRQKLGLAIALVTEPRALLLDEPTTGVDPDTRQEFWQLIVKLVASRDVAVLLTTPYMDEASRCTRVGFMRAGKWVLEGTPRQLRARLSGRIVELAGSPEGELLRLAQAAPQVENTQRFGDRLHLRLGAGLGDGGLEALSAHLRARAWPAVEITRLAYIEPLLEDVYIALAEG
jgi:ABC-2 type transport system ATP-binding protein